MARVVRIVPEYAGGAKASYGLQPVYYNLSKVQAASGHEVHVVARRRLNEPTVEVSDGVTIHRVGNPFTLNALTKVRELTRDRSPAVIHTHSSTGAFLAGSETDRWNSDSLSYPRYNLFGRRSCSSVFRRDEGRLLSMGRDDIVS